MYNGAPARFVLGTETLRIWRRFGITRRRFGSKAVKTVVTTYLQLAAAELKKNGKFKLGGVLNMKLKKKPAKAARKGVNPFANEPCVFKAEPASKTVRIMLGGNYSYTKTEYSESYSLAINYDQEHPRSLFV